MRGQAGLRLLLVIPTLLAILFVLFALLNFAPGDPVSAFVGDYPVPDAYRQTVIETYNLDASFWQQFLAYLGQLLQGNLGYSYASSADVTTLIASRLPATLLLVLSGMAVGALLGILVGLVSAVISRRGADAAINTTVLIAFAVPGFWLGQILVLLFAVNLQWFPASGLHSFGVEGAGLFVDSLWHLVLPVAALCVLEFASIARIMRQSTFDVLAMDYITTAELQGQSRRRIVMKHVLRNASLPAITVIGYRFGQALAGALLIEKIFGWPGMGLLLEGAVLRRDTQTILGVVLVIAILVLAANVLVDITYRIADPRIRRG